MLKYFRLHYLLIIGLTALLLSVIINACVTRGSFEKSHVKQYCVNDVHNLCKLSISRDSSYYLLYRKNLIYYEDEGKVYRVQDSIFFQSIYKTPIYEIDINIRGHNLPYPEYKKEKDTTFVVFRNRTKGVLRNIELDVNHFGQKVIIDSLMPSEKRVFKFESLNKLYDTLYVIHSGKMKRFISEKNYFIPFEVDTDLVTGPVILKSAKVYPKGLSLKFRNDSLFFVNCYW